MKAPTLLIIDDNVSFTDSVAFALDGFRILKAHSVAEARKILNSDIDIVLLDLVFDEKKPDILDGLGLIPFIKERCPDTQVIVLTSYPAIDTTVKAIKSGATDFLNKKDLNWSEWKIRLLNYARQSQQISDLKRRNLELETGQTEAEIIGNSPQIDFLRRRLKDLASNSSDVSIFITGETGTGKNLAVKYFLKHSLRKPNPFREFSILELSESLIESELFGHVRGAFTGATADKKGLFELADKGILFLDEIGDYDLKIQTKILRFLDEKTITPVGSGKTKQLDIQLILASNQDIPGLIRDKKFREDLYQRINRVRIELPPLRERKEDISTLAFHFFNHFRQAEKTKLISIEPDVLKIFNNYPWPGNVRELQSVIWDACTKARLLGDKILKASHLKKELSENSLTKQQESNFLSFIEKKVIVELEAIEIALQDCRGRKNAASGKLNLTPDQMRYRVLKYNRIYPSLVCRYKNIVNYYDLISCIND